MTINSIKVAAGLLGIGLMTALAVSGEMTPVARAADHEESPLTAEDPAADLGDFYAWATPSQTVVLVATYAGYAVPNAEAVYDADVLYTFHISNDGDAVSEHDIEVRFGQNGLGDWGVKASNVPGAAEPLMGGVEETVSSDGAMLYAGLRDDPFFFDLEGFQMTLDTGDLSFDASRDFAVLQNTNAIVLEIPIAAIGGDSTSLRLWTSTARK